MGNIDDYKWEYDVDDNNRNQADDHEVQIMMKLSYLQARITELYKVKLQISSLFEIRNHKDFKLQNKKEQATIMELVDMIKDMRNLNVDYYNSYCKENKWAKHIMDTFANDVFKNQNNGMHFEYEG